MATATDRPRSSRRRRRGQGEFELLAKVRAAVEKGGRGRGVLVGIGDDCAVVESPSASTAASRRIDRAARRVRPRGGPAAAPALVLTTDTMVEGVHFRSSWLTPRELGIRAFRAAVSDIAAMGARPRHALLSLEIPGDERGFGPREALALVRAVASEARRTGAALVGGNVSGGVRTGVTVTVIGEVAAAPLLRSGARPGDLVFVTGSLGGAAAGWRTLLAPERVPGRPAPAARESGTAPAAYRRPPVRLDFAAALCERGLASAMIDISDGLLQDLGHVADESGVAIRVDASAVPVHRAAARMAPPRRSRQGPHPSPSTAPAMSLPLELALSGGEDYELAFTAPEASRAAIEKIAASRRTPVTVIGFVAKGRAGVADLHGRPFTVRSAGFDHLRTDRAAPARER